jgi:hypothetical protein
VVLGTPAKAGLHQCRALFFLVQLTPREATHGSRGRSRSKSDKGSSQGCQNPLALLLLSSAAPSRRRAAASNGALSFSQSGGAALERVALM